MEDGVDHADRRDDRKPVVRTQRRAAVARARARLPRRLTAEALEALLERAERLSAKPLPLDAEARAALIGMADGDGRAVLTLAEEVWRAARPGETLDAARPRRGRAAARADLRQGAGRPLQSDLGAAQMRARLRPGRGALLSRAHARRRRGPAVHRPPRRAHGVRGHRPRRPAGARHRQRRQGRLRFSRQPGGRAGDRRGGRLCRDRAEIERALQGVRRRAGARRERTAR